MSRFQVTRTGERLFVVDHQTGRGYGPFSTVADAVSVARKVNRAIYVAQRGGGSRPRTRS